MNRKEMNKLRNNIHVIMSDCNNSNYKKVYIKVLRLISEAENMRRTLQSITKIGADHCT